MPKFFGEAVGARIAPVAAASLILTAMPSLISRTSSRKPVEILVLVLMLASAFAGCEREQRKFTGPAPSSGRPAPPRVGDLQPGGPGAPSVDKKAVSMPPKNHQGPFDENAWAVSEGKRLFTWYNCVGCHANGGGGMGPPLMDDKWIYGSEPEQIHATIVEGRPNGMPAFGGKIPDQQIWQIVAYVRSLSGQLPKDVRSTRNDHMSIHPSDQARRPETPKPSGEPHEQP